MSMGRDLPGAETPGTILAGRYRVVRELGRGGMARVLEVEDLFAQQRRVALKLLKAEIEQHGEAMERFRREGEFLLSLRHPAIVAVETSGQLPDGRLYLAMELLHGETLGARMRRGRMNPGELSPILAGAAVGLAAAHRAGVIHRDLKPDNVFLAKTPTDRALQVKLLDFGISKIDGRATLTRTGQVLGTPRYMAPEQLAAERDLDGRTDVYALGVILYEALAGQPPFPATLPSELIVSILQGKVTPLRALRPDLPPPLEAVVMRAMSRVRDARHATATELAEAWFDVVHAHAPKSPAVARPDMRTSVFGGIGSASDRPGPSPLAPGTFRDFDPNQTRLGLPEEAGRAARAAANARAAADARAPEAPRVAAEPANVPRAAPHPAPAGAQAPVAAAPVPAKAPARPESPSPTVPAIAIDVRARAAERARGEAEVAPPRADDAWRDDEAPITLPTRKFPWFAIALGGMAIAGAFFGLDLERKWDARTASADAGVRASVDAAIDASADAARAPEGTTAPQESPTVAAARAAWTSGDARRCVELATEALSQHPDAPAYRLRGDCYRALHDDARAIRSYQRYCAIAADAPDVASVRAIVVGLGSTCP